MKKILIFAALLVLPILVMVAAPHAAHASGANTNIWDPSILKGPLVSCSGDPTGSNACKDLCDLINTVINIVYFAIGLVIWVIAPLSFVVAGAMYLVAGASPEMLGTAKKTILGAVIGLTIVLFSWLIINTLVGVLGITKIGGFGTSTCSVATPPASSGTTGGGGTLGGGLSGGTGGGGTSGGTSPTSPVALPTSPSPSPTDPSSPPPFF